MGGVSMEWKEVRLGDVCSIQRGASPRPIQKFISKEGMPWVKIADATGISSRYISSTSEYIIKEGISKSRIVHPGDLIVSNSATPGLPKFMAIEACVHDGWLIIRDLDGIDKVFLYYVFINIRRRLSNQANGSVFMNLKTDIVKDFVIKLPTLDDQRRIASILSSLDQKIELNNKINADLEEMAQAIFKNWFVDFEPFKDGKFVDSELGMIPEGWKVGTLGDFCKCLLGGTPSRSKEEYWNGDVNWINSGEINKFRILEASEKITELGLSKSATKLLPKKTTVLAITGATLGQVSLLEIDTCANQSVIGVLENAEVPYEYIYPFIKDRIEMLIQHQTGGAQQHINKDNVESLIFLLPAKNVLENYISLVGPMYKRIESQCFENLYLSTLRDTLLPRLMSGEIEVPE